MAPQNNQSLRIGTAQDAVALATNAFAEQLYILPSARRSARQSSYRDPVRVFQVLALLAFFGTSNGEFSQVLKSVMGGKARWRRKDSSETVKTFRDKRRWLDSAGVTRLFERHVTLGGGEAADSCVQIYYRVNAKGKIEIAWVGKHLPTVSKNT